MIHNSRIIVITGPTASGKSSLAMRIAEHIPCEIISADSMQIYKGLDIGTAKPEPYEQEKVKHYMIDILDISQPLNVFKFIDFTKQAVNEVTEKNKIPLIVGGSGMYIHALLYGLDPLPADPAIRKNLEKKFGTDDNFDALRGIMKEKSPDDYSRWHNHHRKLLRAYEVFLITGKSITSLQKKWYEEKKLKYTGCFYYLHWDMDELKRRIKERTRVMLRKGWIEETRKLIEHGLLSSPTAKQAIGYKIIAYYLEKKIDYQTMEERVNTATWQFAKRQITWFRNKHPELEIINCPVEPDVLIKRIQLLCLDGQNNSGIFADSLSPTNCQECNV